MTNQTNATILLTGDAVYFLLFKAVLSFESVDEILKCHYSNECQGCDPANYSVRPVKVVLAFESHANEILNDLGNES